MKGVIDLGLAEVVCLNSFFLLSLLFYNGHDLLLLVKDTMQVIKLCTLLLEAS